MPLDEYFRRAVIGGMGAFTVVAEERATFAEAIRPASVGDGLCTSNDEFAKFGKRSTGRANSPGKVRNYVLWFG